VKSWQKQHRESIEDDEWFLRDESDTTTVSVEIRVKKPQKGVNENGS